MSSAEKPFRPTTIRSGGVTYIVPDNVIERFVFFARDCLTGARILHERSAIFASQDNPEHISQRVASLGEYILTAHALELGLKASLAKHGVSEDTLKWNYSHDLEKLYQDAVKKGLKLSSVAHVDLIIAWIRQYHAMPLRYGYRVRHIELPACDFLFPIIDELLS